MWTKQRKRVVSIVLVFFLMGAAAVYVEKSEGALQGNELTRGEPGSGLQEETLYYELEQEGEQYALELQIPARKLSGEEWDELLSQASEEAELSFLGENTSADHVSGKVELCETLQHGLVQVTWMITPDNLIDMEGHIQEEQLMGEGGTVAMVTAELSCGDYRADYEFPICIYPEEKSREGWLAQQIYDYIRQQEEFLPVIELPEELDGQKVSWKYPRTYTLWIFAGLGVVAAVCMSLTEKERQRRDYKQRNKRLLMDYPDIVSRLGLLLEAGMSLPMAWERLSQNYERKRKDKERRREGYEEMLITLHELQDGMGERRALEQFGERCGVAQYRRFASILTQNMRKGTAGIGAVLSKEAADAFLQRKNMAQKMGEEAGTKLLFPMMLMLLVVMVILIVPACMTIQI
ncbi:MAG: type II secretion system F family protein [Lachnospiraceae bacterium]|nr:type II secretion system F family protein [Lachnospiraceae bacterium]